MLMVGILIHYLPTFSFLGDSNTGIGKAGLDQLSLIAGGVEGVRVEATGITVNRNIANFEAKLSGLPEDEQQFLKIQRKLDISQEAYNIYTAKRSEAAIR